MVNSISITTHFLNSLEAPNGDRPPFINALEKTKKCISGYSAKQGFWNKIAGLTYRIWNAIKAIIGQSDWQRAKRSIDNKNFKLIDANLRQMHKLDIFLNVEYPKELTHIEDADSFLYALIKLNESSTIKEIMQLDREDIKEEEKNIIAERLQSNPKAQEALTFKGHFAAN